MHWVYLLYCGNDRFFIGETTTIHLTLERHFLRKGTAFTKKYNPIYVMGMYNVSTNLIYNTFFKNEEDYAKWFVQNLTIVLNNMHDACIFTNGTSNITRKIIIRHGVEPVRPVCHCGISCEIYEEYDVKWYGCPSRNTEHTITNALIRQYPPCYFMKTVYDLKTNQSYLKNKLNSSI